MLSLCTYVHACTLEVDEGVCLVICYILRSCVYGRGRWESGGYVFSHGATYSYMDAEVDGVWGVRVYSFGICIHACTLEVDRGWGVTCLYMCFFSYIHACT